LYLSSSSCAQGLLDDYMLLNKLIKFRPVTILFLLGVIAFFYGHASHGLSYWFLVAWVHLFLLVQFFGAYLIGMNFHVNSINSLATKEKKVLLTFDDGPHNPNTTRVLEVLKKHEVKAVFFVIGKNIAGNESVLQHMIADGHQIGNHSFSHDAKIDLWSSKKITADLEGCQQLIENYQPVQKVFRPPYGVTNPNMAKAIRQTQLTSVGWNIRSYDTSIKDVEKIKARILLRLKPGAIILLHDRLDYMPELLEALIPEIKKRGYGFAERIN
jgi:peptidoglycan/xylan/chitin deacetylase (PgdA/CDA1 family)